MFKRIWGRSLKNGERALDSLDSIKREFQTFMHKTYPKFHKIKKSIPTDVGIYNRILTPNELLASELPGKYTEIGIRSNLSSKQVNAKNAAFKGVIVEKFNIQEGNAISNEMADLLEKAKQADLPIIMI